MASLCHFRDVDDHYTRGCPRCDKSFCCPSRTLQALYVWLLTMQIIAKALRGDAVSAFWSGTSFLLSSTVFQPSFASMSVIFGRRPLVYVALTFFTVGAIICGV